MYSNRWNSLIINLCLYVKTVYLWWLLCIMFVQWFIRQLFIHNVCVWAKTLSLSLQLIILSYLAPRLIFRGKSHIWRRRINTSTTAVLSSKADCVYHHSQVRNTFQYPLSKRVCKRLSKRLFRVAAFIIELYREYESGGRPCHCAAALRSLTRGTEIM